MISSLPLAERAERVIKRLDRGIYRRITGDYAGIGLIVFDVERFASDLGTFWFKLYEIGLVADADQNGWSLPVAPTGATLRAALPRLTAICWDKPRRTKKAAA